MGEKQGGQCSEHFGCLCFISRGIGEKLFAGTKIFSALAEKVMRMKCGNNAMCLDVMNYL